MKNALINNKKDIKYKDYEYKNSKLTILGIGQKAIKYTIDDGEEQFAFYDSSEAYWIGCVVLTSFDNEIWNEEIREKIAAQKKYCKENKDPHFAPEDGFCWSCHKQIYADYPSVYGTDWGKTLESASTELITGCPHCHRSYCD